jgi:hypothetical protein
MNAEVFRTELAAWFKDAHDEALRLFDNGCQPTDCLNIATAYANSRANMRASRQQALSGATIRMPFARQPQ